MSDFLLELRCEEIPARMQAGARADLERLFAAALKDAGVAHGAMTVWSTPRRLALIARDLPLATEPVREEVKGPRTSAPEQALEGFLRKTGLAKEALTERDGVWFAITEKPGRETDAVLAEAIPALIRAFPWPKSMRWGAASLSTGSLRWVRPLSGIVALLDGAVVPCEVDGIAAGNTTLGHRFHHSGEITLSGADEYAPALRAAHVIVNHEEREALIRIHAKDAAFKAGLVLVEDEGLVIENAGLTEWPVPLLGRFDPAFLEVPPEVIQLTARVNQKYFICRDAAGKLANAFVCTANIAAKDGGAAIVDGNRKVLAARLSDARFFWTQDRKVPLAEQAKKLERITFHEKLGTVADKVDRVAKLARWLVEEGIVGANLPLPGGERVGERGLDAGSGSAPSPASPTPTQPSPERGRALLADQAELAAKLCKADLVTEMVGEFPELQGLMGGYYARAEGLPDAVADAIRDHYKPVGQGDDVPTAPVTVAVALADKLDTLAGFFAVDERPTGSKDPFALRRAAISIISLILLNGMRAKIKDVLYQAQIPVSTILYATVAGKAIAGVSREVAQALLDGRRDASLLTLRQLVDDDYNASAADVAYQLASGWYDSMTFVVDRLKVQQREAGVRHDLIDAVFALGGEDDLVRLLARVHALQAFITTPDGANLHAGYKRAANILKKEGFTSPSPPPRRGEGAATPEAKDGQATSAAHPHPTLPLKGEGDGAEAALIAALDSAEPRAATAVEAEDFTAAMAALASLRGPIDAFFEGVTVNDPDPATRAARLALLDRFRAAVHKVADFSRIEG